MLTYVRVSKMHMIRVDNDLCIEVEDKSGSLLYLFLSDEGMEKVRKMKVRETVDLEEKS